MAYELALPDLGEGVADGEISRWLVAVGDVVGEDDALVEVQTDKAAVEIPSPVAGRVAAILVEAGATVPVGTRLLVIAQGDDWAAADGAPQAAAPERVQALPAVRRLAVELGVALESVAGTGAGGRVTQEDVRAAAVGADREPVQRVPLAGVRRRIAERLARVQREVPAVTVVEECDFTALAAVRGERSLVAYVLHAVAAALGDHPALNAHLEGEEILLYDRRHVGLAVQTERGLVVPVVREAERRSLDELDAELRRLAAGARADTLAPAELRGSTFTVTSAGRLGGLFATPLVNPPEVAILGVHRVDPRPVVRGGEIVVREVGLVSCSFDHRALDGAQASAFLLDLIARLEAPPADDANAR
jgi:pyruvate/2-oxoglutarate dehydrogenase complex dihydrolipoamide acyltransferase (E2) component